MADAPTPKERVLQAALDEFATYGLAGARISRIAAEAKTSKERVYAYFRSKEELHQAVMAGMVELTMSNVRLDVRDLPDYVGKLFDFYFEHPELQRLVNWQRLEAADDFGPEANALLAHKVETIADAQQTGLIPDDVPALDVLLITTSLASAWAAMLEHHGLADANDPAVRAERRAAAVAATAKLFPATG
jgi:AcrR family transcriptional regulator